MTRHRVPAVRSAGAALLLAAALSGGGSPAAASSESLDAGAATLMAVLRESAGANKQDERLEPWGKVTMQLEDGRELEIEASWFHYLGDMHIRLVFDGPQKLQSATPEDLVRMRLDAEQALTLAARNLRRIYGEPQVRPWASGLMRVDGRANDLSSSYFLDRQFWLDQQRQHPNGLVAAVPQQGGLVFAPLDDQAAVDKLRFSAVALHAGARHARISSALYLFREGKWSVFQPPRGH
ncbi:hypothetical protein WG922_06155 [Ramlibacter sp. AN1015]|uniref:hypothetical protein n=1 Tax=Ramlibacter sp. AN1015 TaxID=3133428 RepID=UPI0030C4A27E